MTDSNLSPENEELKNTGIRDIPRILREKLFEQSGAVMFPEQITPDVVEKSQKSQEQLFEAKTEEDQRFFRAVGAGLLDIPNEIKNIGDWAMGNPYDPDQLINLKALGFEKDGDKDDALYNITKFATGFLIPYGGFSKALTKGGKALQGIKGIKAIKNVKYADKVATGAKWATAGAAADFVAIDAYDDNLFNFMMGVENPIINNGFVKPFFEYLAAPERPGEGDPSNFGEAKLKQLYSGTIFGEIIGGGIVVGTKLAPKAGRVLAEGAEITLDAVTGGPKIFSQKQMMDETIKLFRDIKNNPNRKNFFLRKKRRIDNANLVGSEEFSDEFKEVLDNVPDLNETIPRSQPVPKVADQPVKIDLPDTRGQGKFYHGSAKEIVLEEGGEAFSPQNIYGNGFYTSEDLVTAAKYKKKNRTKGEKPSGVVYEITEKQPVNFYDLDQTVDADLKKYIDDFDDSDYENVVFDAVDELGDDFSLGELFDEIRAYSRSRDVSSSVVIDEIFENFQNFLRTKGFGGFTHQGGKLAGKGKRLHQVKIYFDPFDQIEINKVDLGGVGGAKPPRKPPAGSGAGAEIPDDGLPLLKSKPNPNVWGVEGDPDVLKITSDMWEATGKVLNRVTIPDDFSVEAASAMGYDYLLPAVTKLAKLISPNAPEKHMRVLYLGAIKENKRLATEISKSMTSIEEAFLLGQKVPDELLTKWSGDVIDLIRLTGPTKTISSETAGTVRINQLIDAEPKNLAKTSVDEEVGTAPFGAPGGQTMADRVKQEKFRPTTKQLVEKAKKEITEKKAVPTKEELIEGLKGYIEGNDVDGLLGITRKVLAMQGDGKRLSKLVDGMTLKDRLGRGLRISNEIFINSLLTAPETHIVNIVGSLINVALGPLDLAAGSPIMDTEMKARAVRELVKIFTSTGDNLKAAGKALWLDKNILDERRMFGQDQYERYALRMAGDNFFAKTINFAGHGFRIPGRFMMAGDEFVKQAAFRSHLWGEFSEQATKKGLTGKSWKIYVNSNFDEVIDIVNKQSIREGTDEYILDAYTRALDYAADRTFTEELGKGFFMNGMGSKRTKEIANILKSSPLKPIVPFVTTPINIGKHVLRRTPAYGPIPGVDLPVQLLFGANQAGLPPRFNVSLGRILKEHNDRLMSDDLATAYRANGEATVGGAIWAYFIALAAARHDPEAEIALIGGGHHNRWLREGEKRTDELPYSFRLLQKDENGEIIRGDNGLPNYEYIDILSRIEPIGSLYMTAGDMEYCRDFMADEDYNNAAHCHTALLSRNLNNKYMIQNIAQAFNLTSDVGALRRFYQVPANYITSISNYPASMLRTIKRARGENWYDEMTQRMYKGRFPKRKTKFTKGDLQPQVERQADKGQYSNAENIAGYEFEGNDLGSLMNENNPFQDINTFSLMLMRNYQDTLPGFSADLAPIKSMTTGKLAEYPEGLMGINFGNPFKYRKENDNPQDEYLRRIQFKLVPPSDVIPFGKRGFVGVNLTTPEYNDLKRLIPDIPLNPRTGKFDTKNGIRFPEALLELSRRKKNIEMLKLIESDTSGSIDAQATLKKKQLFLKELQKEARKIYSAYKEAAVEYYKENLLDKDKKTMAENELRRGTNDILKTLEGINLN